MGFIMKRRLYTIIVLFALAGSRTIHHATHGQALNSILSGKVTHLKLIFPGQMLLVPVYS